MKYKNIISIMFLVISITWGCNQGDSGEKQGTENEPAPQEEQVQTPEQTETQPVTPAGEADEYGRKPGDEHYGHDHPPQDQQQQIQTNTQQEAPSGGTDKYGRKPGEEHYGHDHE